MIRRLRGPPAQAVSALEREPIESAARLPAEHRTRAETPG